jgi:hypothetical protein
LQTLKLLFKINSFCLFVFFVSNFSSCKKDKLITDSGAKVQFSQDSVLFDTVFTTIGSATQNIRVRNKNKGKIKISSIQLQGGTASQFIINVDGAKGTTFSDIEIAANDSMYIFIQVNVNPTNSNSPLIITDAINFVVNGNQQKVILEAWGQDAYYHHPTNAIKFNDGSYFTYSIVDSLKGSFTYNGTNNIVWKNDKPHVIYGYCVIDSLESLTIPAGTKVYLNYKAGLWVFRGGQIQVLGQKGNEVIFQGARLEKDFADEPGQWDRIWINEGSDNNIIDYAIIKNAYVGVQAELFGTDFSYKRKLKISNTKIQNMSLWGLYSFAYNIEASNNVISNCQEYSLNILLGGAYSFIHCTFANYWNKDKQRDKTTLNINNYSTVQVLPLNLHIGNCIVDGTLENEITLDLKADSALTYTFSNCWLKSNINTSNQNIFINDRKGNLDDVLRYTDISTYNFDPLASENRITNFTGTLATQDAMAIPTDITGKTRNTSSVTAGAYETQ